MNQETVVAFGDAFARMCRALEIEVGIPVQQHTDLVALEESAMWAAFCEAYPTDWEAVHKAMYQTYRKLYRIAR